MGFGWNLFGDFGEADELFSAPSAACSGAEAFGKLTGVPHAMDPQIVEDLPPGNVKAKAKLVVRFHGNIAKWKGKPQIRRIRGIKSRNSEAILRIQKRSEQTA